MIKAAFTYPGGTKKALTDITLHVRLSSRVAVIGANGAGKSTLIKLLTAEMKPQEGKVRETNLAGVVMGLPTRRHAWAIRPRPDRGQCRRGQCCALLRGGGGDVLPSPPGNVMCLTSACAHAWCPSLTGGSSPQPAPCLRGAARLPPPRGEPRHQPRAVHPAAVPGRRGQGGVAEGASDLHRGRVGEGPEAGRWGRHALLLQSRALSMGLPVCDNCPV